MYVGRERERWGVVPEHDLDLFCVPSGAEEHRCAGVPQRAQAGPTDSRCFGRWFDDPPEDVRPLRNLPVWLWKTGSSLFGKRLTVRSR